MDARPPRWADRFLRWYCDPDLLEEIQGDAYELFYQRLETRTQSYARLKFILDVFRFLRWSNIRKSNWYDLQDGSWRFAFTLAWRRAKGNHLNSMIKVLGIAISFGYALTLGLIAFDEWSYDHHQINADRIFRVGSTIKFSGNTTHYAVSPLPLADALKQEIPEVEGSLRFMAEEYPLLKKDDNFFSDMKTLSVDSNYLRILIPDFRQGDKRALDEPNTIVITQSLAERIFGEEDPLGQSLLYNNHFLLEVTGIIEDPKHSSHLKADALISWNTFDQMENWDNVNAYTYILLREGASIEDVRLKIHSALKDLDELVSEEYNASYEPIFENIKNIHLSSEKDEDIAIKGSLNYVYLLGSIAILFAALGIVNYVNLISAELTKDSKKIGLLSIFGGNQSAYRKTLISESVLYLVIAGLLTLIIVIFNLNLAETFLGMKIDYSLVTSPAFLGSIILLFSSTLFVVYFNSSIYIKLNSSISALKKATHFNKTGLSFRQILVSIQFSFSIVMMALVMVLIQQFYFLQSKDKGFNDDDVMVIKRHVQTVSEAEVFRSALLKHPGVMGVANSSYYPGVIETKYSFLMESSDGMKKRLTPVIFSSADYLNIIGAQILSGRSLDDARAEDHNASFIINEAAAREFGWDEPLGKRISGPVGANDQGDRDGFVIGVVKDFNFASLYNRIEPLIIILEERNIFLYIKLKGNIPDLVQKIEASYKTQWPDIPLEWEFLDSKYKSLYKKDYDSQYIFQLGLLISVFISCLGIFSISALMAGLRQREAGIRKVVGANPLQLFWLHLKSFSKLVIISLVLAWPVIGYLSTYWLNSFAYRIELGPTYYIIPAIISFTIVFATAGFHGIKSVRVNPVDVLKCEG